MEKKNKNFRYDEDAAAVFGGEGGNLTLAQPAPSADRGHYQAAVWPKWGCRSEVRAWFGTAGTSLLFLQWQVRILNHQLCVSLFPPLHV